MCGSILSQEKININFKILGIPDEYMINGSQSEVLDYYDMEPNKISELAKALMNR